MAIALTLLTSSGSAGDAALKTLPRGLPHATTVARALGDVTLVSASGHDFELYEIAPITPKKAARVHLLVQGGLHGNEEQASAFVVWLARRYARGDSPLNALGEDVAIDFLPYANPDGTLGQNRYNARGVNLNRNFGVLWGVTRENPGATAFSEPETRAVRALFEKRHYLAAADVHGYINWVVMPTEPEAMKERGRPPSTRQTQDYAAWRDALREEMAVMPGYQLKTAGKLGDGGAFEDWAFWGENTLALCLEMESFQRFAKPWRKDFNDPSGARAGAAPSVDMFKRYEAFLARMFERALVIKADERQKARLAAE